MAMCFSTDRRGHVTDFGTECRYGSFHAGEDQLSEAAFDASAIHEACNTDLVLSTHELEILEFKIVS